MEKLGPYDFLGVVGRGGMGSVYRGRLRETGEIHAVKVLALNFTDDDHFRNRFVSEIQALIKLDHPNIVRILSYGQEMGNLYFAMELVEGKSLFQLQKKAHRFDWREILTIGKQVAKGLRHAHDRGIIHRDLKPGNLLMPIDEMGQKGEIKITDFGIAKRFGSSQNTGENVLGTMDFMSPEQAKGQPVSFRSDLYSLGTVMYTLLSGQPPFSANSVEESLRNLTRVPPPSIGSLVPDVPEAIDELIQKLMAKRPDQRVATAQALLYKIEEIEKLLLESSQAPTFEAKPRKHDETFDVTPVGDIPTRANTNRSSKKPVNVTTIPTDVPTIDSEEEFTETESTTSARKIDYYNTVTDHTRNQHDRELLRAERSAGRGIIPILLTLLAIIGISAFGVYQVSRPPVADDLFATIEASKSQPDSILKQATLFLENYPDDPRATQVKEIHRVGDAIKSFDRLANSLAITAKLPGKNRLTEIEQQFIDIVELAENNQDLATTKMQAFVTVHQGDSDLSDRDRKCLAAAKSYHIKIRADAYAASVRQLEKIRVAMDTAAKESDPEAASQFYRSIIELYEDKDWDESEEGLAGRNLLEEARRKYDELMNRTNEPESSPSALN